MKTGHKVEPTNAYKITVVMTNSDDTKMTKTYQRAKDAANHYADFSTLNWDYGRKQNDPNYQFNFDRYHAYRDRLYRRVLPYFQQFMK